VNVASGDSARFTITANANYHLDSLIVDGVKVTSASSYTFFTVAANPYDPHNLCDQHVCDHFDSRLEREHQPPWGRRQVNAGDSLKFTLTANANYHIDSLIVDGVSQAVASSYTFHTVTATHTIRAAFRITTFSITAASGSNGSISPSGSVSVTAETARVYLQPERRVPCGQFDRRRGEGHPRQTPTRSSR